MSFVNTGTTRTPESRNECRLNQAANDWSSLSVGGSSVLETTGGDNGGGIGGGSDFITMMIRGGGEGLRQNPPFKIQIISSGDSHTQTM
jgi:hypothetical protein